MKKLSFVLFLISLFNLSVAQNGEKIIIGNIDSVRSNILNETRKIWVYVPNQGNSLYSVQRYPVVYLLDGNSHFHSVTGLIEQLSTNGNTILPEMIVVAIPNTNRTRDLTPSHSLLGTDGKEMGFLSSSGGGENFTSFLEKELIPYVDTHYPTAPHRMLIGHSFGGLFAIHTLVHHPALFNTYISIDPSLWWDHQKLLKEATAILQTNQLKGKALFVGVANTMPASMDMARVTKDTTENTFHMRSILQFTKTASAATNSGLRFDWKYYPQDDHGSAPLITEYDGLRFIFDYYKPTLNGDPNSITAELVNAKYKTISEKIGYPILPGESAINNMGYALLQQKKFDKAFVFFDMNINNYPKSSNVYDSMGDYYVATGDKAKAIEFFEKALTLKEVQETREKLEKLKKPSK